MFGWCIASLVAAAVAAQPDASRYQLDSAGSELTVHVFKAGLFSGFLHDHLFVPQQWSCTVEFDPAHPEAFRAQVSVATASLRDNQPKLSAEDRAKVESQIASPEVLDAARFPEIRFTADRLVVSGDKSDELQGTVSGKLSLHGVTRPLEFPVRLWRRGDARVVLGKASFNQSDFGVSPLRKAGGAIAVEDKVLVEFALRLRPAQ
jgi:polyisoprenoid-binding protein YceI